MEIGGYALRIEFAFVYSWPSEPFKWDTSEKDLREYDLWTVLGGEGELQHDGGAIGLSSGDCLLLRPGMRYCISHNPDNPFVLLPVHFNFTDSAGEIVRPQEECLPGLYRKIEDVAWFRSLLERVIGAHVGKSPAASDSFLRAALFEADRQSVRAVRTGDGIRALAIERILKRMIAFPEKSISIPVLARGMNISRSSFMALFRNTTGTSPCEYLINARIEKAKTILRNSRESVEDIAKALGYRSSAFFCRQFKARMGFSPLQFRKRNWE